MSNNLLNRAASTLAGVLIVGAFLLAMISFFDSRSRSTDEYLIKYPIDIIESKSPSEVQDLLNDARKKLNRAIKRHQLAEVADELRAQGFEVKLFLIQSKADVSPAFSILCPKSKYEHETQETIDALLYKAYEQMESASKDGSFNQMKKKLEDEGLKVITSSPR
ncbi:MAG: hypothetical protein Q4D65_00575 [Peptostreptococcaceae bacterium]|nr:hypothetical protein [Peptostreptococcaceae bacterium]